LIFTIKICFWVDQFDSTVGRKDHKMNDWSRYVITYLFRGCVNNSWRYWLVQNKMKTKDCSLRTFIERIVWDYVKEKNISLDNIHQIVKKKKRKRCVICFNSGTNLYCQECSVVIHVAYFHKHFSVKLKINSNKIKLIVLKKEKLIKFYKLD